MTADECDKCGDKVWYTRYDAPIEEAVAMREKGLEPPIAQKLCRKCWALSADVLVRDTLWKGSHEDKH